MVDLFFKNCSPNSVTSFKRDLNNGDGMCYCMSLEHLVQCLDGGRKKEIFKKFDKNSSLFIISLVRYQIEGKMIIRNSIGEN